MRYLLAILVLFGLGACTVGDIPPERQALYDSNKPDCNKTPEKCIHGYPW